MKFDGRTNLIEVLIHFRAKIIDKFSNFICEVNSHSLQFVE